MLNAPAVKADPLTLSPGQAELLQLKEVPDTVFVANPDVASVNVPSANRILVTGNAVGSTTLYALGSDQSVLLRRTVDVQRDLSRMRREIAAIASPHQVKVQPLNDGIMLSGMVNDPATANRIVSIAEGLLDADAKIRNEMNVQAAVQVNLRVKVAEMSRRVSKRIGVNWDALLDTGNFALGLFTGRPAAFDTTTGMFLRQPGPESFGAFGAGISGNDGSLNAVIDALASEDLASVLAEPNLTAMSGETASFLAGGEFPIPIGTEDGEIEIEFREFGVRLEFTPTVLARDRISLQVRTEVSELTQAGSIQTQGIQVPGLQTNRAQTNVHMASGQSFAIAGLLQETTEEGVDKIPGLADIPVLGPLFASTRFQREQSELVILVTPYIVRPSRQEAFAVPQDGYAPAGDVDRAVEGRVGRSRPAAGSGSPDGGAEAILRGSAGFAY